MANGFPKGDMQRENMHLVCQLEVRTHMSQTLGPICTQINPDTSKEALSINGTQVQLPHR